MSDEMKRCGGKNGCGKLLPTWMFDNCNSTSDGLQSHCNDCRKKYRIINRKRIGQRKRERRASMYPGQWDIELKKQNYECAFPDCHCKENLVPDHDHNTDRFRAILCPKHNNLLGMADDDSKILQQAIEYLRKYNV